MLPITGHENETAQEKRVHQALEAALEPGEALQEYTTGKFSAGIFSNPEYWIGLSDRRFICLRPGKAVSPNSVYFAFIQNVVCTARTPTAAKAVLQIKLSSTII